MSWKPDMFIYHSPCDDGFGSAWAVHQRWGDAVEYIPGTYGKPAPDVAGKNVLIGDFSYKYDQLVEMSFKARSIIILDHHKTAQEDLKRLPPIHELDEAGLEDALMFCRTSNMPDIAVHFNMERSGAALVWEFCHPGAAVPQLIRFIEDRDLWTFENDRTRAFTLWLRSHPYDFATWDRIAGQLEHPAEFDAIMAQATAIESFYDQKVGEMVAQARSQMINGIAVPVVNCSWAFASDVAHELLKANPDARFAACYYDRGDGTRTYSLRSEDHRMDVSAIAKRYGGGGHRNAAGFEVPLP